MQAKQRTEKKIHEIEERAEEKYMKLKMESMHRYTFLCTCVLEYELSHFSHMFFCSIAPLFKLKEERVHLRRFGLDSGTEDAPLIIEKNVMMPV